MRLASCLAASPGSSRLRSGLMRIAFISLLVLTSEAGHALADIDRSGTYRNPDAVPYFKNHTFQLSKNGNGYNVKAAFTVYWTTHGTYYFSLIGTKVFPTSPDGPILTGKGNFEVTYTWKSHYSSSGVWNANQWYNHSITCPFPAEVTLDFVTSDKVSVTTTRPILLWDAHKCETDGTQTTQHEGLYLAQ